MSSKFSFPSTERSDTRERAVRIYRITIGGSVANALLIVLKFVAGIVGQSAAMVADAVHSLSDFVTDLVVLVFVRIAGKPKDSDHAYGHGKFELIATGVIALALLLVGAILMGKSSLTIYQYYAAEEPIQVPNHIALWIALLSIAIKEILFRLTMRVAREVKSKSVEANAWHHRSDAYSSIATLLGISGAILLGEDWVVLEPIAAVIVSVFIVKVGVELIRPAINGLVEASLPEDIRGEILQLVAQVEGVQEVCDLHTRDLGNSWAIEFNIEVDPSLTVSKAHQITDRVEALLREKYGEETHVVIHVEPYHGIKKQQ